MFCCPFRLVMVSFWFIQLAGKHIRGEITLEEFDDLLTAHCNEVDYILKNGTNLPS